MELAGVRVYTYYFSPNDSFEIFETQILLLEESLREASRRSLIAGDFNSKSPEWGEARVDRRGILDGEMVTRNDLIVLKQGRDFDRGFAGHGRRSFQYPKIVLGEHEIERKKSIKYLGVQLD